ncbi:MAG: NFYB/HAP3 family transcription factor subunit [Planctomycetes bacterium]|nr:NFYB/HAP3 family transcription factor subunit [Planctomycetota bacterium]
MGEILVVRSKVKEAAGKALKGKSFNVASDFADALSNAVEDLIKKAARRCDDNGRKTIQPRDL